MEKKFFKEVTIVLLPPLLNGFELNSNDAIFLGPGDIISSDSSSSVKLDEKTRKTPSTFISRIAKTDFSKRIVDLISSRAKEPFMKVMLVNYPMNNDQLENLEFAGFDISKLIVVSHDSFDVLAIAKKERFLCPICFKSYAKEIFLKQNRYLCPLDKENFSVSYIDEFTEYLTRHYLQDSIKVIQNFARSEREKGRKILRLNVDSKDVSIESIRKSLLNIAEKG